MVSSFTSGTEAQQEQKKRILEQQKLMAEKKKEALPAIFPRNQPMIVEKNGQEVPGPCVFMWIQRGHAKPLMKLISIYIGLYLSYNPS